MYFRILYTISLFTILNSNISFCQHLELIKDISSGASNSEVVKSIVDGENLFVVILNPDQSQSLWFYDKANNTTTHLFKDSTYNNTSFAFGKLTLWNHKVFFAHGSIYARQLWVSDGTANGTIKLKHNIGYFAQGGESGYGGFMPAPNIMYFYTRTSTTFGSTELWRTDGTENGTYLLDYSNRSGGMTETGSQSSLFYFTKYSVFNDNSAASELWASNGSSTFKVRTMFQNTTMTGFNITSFPEYSLIAIDSVGHFKMAVVGGNAPTFQQIIPKVKATGFYISSIKMGYHTGKVVFNWNGGTDNEEIWITDGTLLGTSVLTNSLNNPINFEHYGDIDKYYFFEGYMSQPLNPSYKDFAVINKSNRQYKIFTTSSQYINPQVRKNFFPPPSAEFTVPKALIGDKFYFIETLSRDLIEIDTNGTLATKIFAVPYNSPFKYLNLYNVNNRLLIRRVENNKSEDVLLVKKGNTIYNLTDSLPSPKPTHLTVFANTGNNIYFTASDSLNGKKIWISNGTSIGTYRLSDFNASPSSSSPNNFQSFDNGLFFLANDGQNDREIWYSQGDANSTIFKGNVFTNQNTPYVNGSAKLGADIYILYAGNYLVRHNQSGNTPVLTPLSLGQSTLSANFEPMGDELYFTYESSSWGNELYKITSTGTVDIVKDIYTGSATGSFPSNLKAVGNTLFFSADGNGTRRELYKSDGTSAGTIIVKDINIGTGSTNFKDFNSYNQKLIFVTDSSKLWISDGTSTGTTIIQDFGGSSRILSGFKEFEGKFYFGVKNSSNDGLYRINNQFNVEFVSSLNWGSLKTIEFGIFLSNLYFSSNGGLQSYNSSTNSISLSFANLNSFEFTNAFNSLYFRGCLNEECEVWKINQSETITKEFDINTGSKSSNPNQLFLLGRNLYFSAYRDDVGMELFRITDCPLNLNITSPHILSQKLESQNIINSQAMISQPYNVIYDAGQFVNLKPGFEVTTGGIFKVYINGCQVD
jgi:ELWxxDGT repeat protein